MIEPLSPVPDTVRPSGHVVTRVFDVTVAALALLLLLPLIAVVCLAILLESGRPVLFVQCRLGLHGKPFNILKFKKFRDACDGLGPGLTVRGDRRMTWVGAFLQQTKLDEVPQFLNVVRGDMSIVGPRPESMRFANCFRAPFRSVLDYVPGIFGPNQILFRDEAELLAGRADVETYYREVLFPLKASVDLSYFAGCSLASNLRLLIGAAIAVCGGYVRIDSIVFAKKEVPEVSPRDRLVVPPVLDLPFKG